MAKEADAPESSTDISSVHSAEHPTRGDSFAIVMTGTEFGPVRLRYEPYDQALPLPLDGWDDVVEVSMRLTDATTIHGPIPDDRVRALPPVSHRGAGTYRIRVHTRGRDAARDLGDIDGTPVEDHLLQAWPAPRARKPATNSPTSTAATTGTTPELQPPWPTAAMATPPSATHPEALRNCSDARCCRGA